MKVSKGLSTWAGLVGALGAFVLALATFMDTFNELDPLAGLGPLAAAGAVLWKVIDGRMKQATALAAKTPAPVQTRPVQWGTTVSTATGWSTPLAPIKHGEFDREPASPPADELRELTDCA